MNTEGRLVDGKWITRGKFSLKGVSDIVGILPGGRFLAIEVKRPGNERGVTLEQRAFIDRINKSGGLAFVATSISDVRARLEGVVELA